MMGQLLGVPGAFAAFGVALLIFGFAPGMALALIVRLMPDHDRRRELQAELYTVPRWERPFWVFEQLEVALRIGVFPTLEWYWGRWVWHRCKLVPGVERHRLYPDSFWIPEDEVKAQLRPGDSVKLLWEVKRLPGEKMWVTITHREGDQLVGTVDNSPVCAYLDYGETVKFHIDDIIDYIFDDERAAA